MICIKLKDFLLHYGIECDSDFMFDGICVDSRMIKKNKLYLCLDEKYLDTIDYTIDMMVLTTRYVNDKTIAIDNLNDLYLDMIHYFYDYPTSKVKLIGVTGTNGKTTIAYLLHKLVKNSMYIGTLNVIYDDIEIETVNTTPALIDNLHYINEGIKKGVKYVFIEVSSHALCQNRVDMMDFDIAIFTNLTQDHLDYHNDMESYFNAKKKLFDNLKKDKIAIINKDDIYGKKLIKSCKCKVIPYSYFDIEKSKYSEYASKIVFNNIKLKYKLVGSFNAYNVMAIYKTLNSLGFNKRICKKKISQITCVPGRMDKVKSKKRDIYIDYAHTPDALEKSLFELKNLCKGKLHVVFGCGGNRDKGKRSKMGQIAAKYADCIYLTNDNPRDEDQLAIIDDIASSIKNRRNLYINPDRYESIEYAILKMEKKDILLIAGKGHEDYMIVNGEKMHFSDKETVECILNH